MTSYNILIAIKYIHVILKMWCDGENYAVLEQSSWECMPSLPLALAIALFYDIIIMCYKWHRLGGDVPAAERITVRMLPLMTGVALFPINKMMMLNTANRLHCKKDVLGRLHSVSHRPAKFFPFHIAYLILIEWAHARLAWSWCCCWCCGIVWTLHK